MNSNGIRVLTPSEEELVIAGVDENPGVEDLDVANVENVENNDDAVPLNRRARRGNFRPAFGLNYGNSMYFLPNRASLRRSNKRVKYGYWGRVNQPR